MRIFKLLLSFILLCQLSFADYALDGVPGLIFLKNFAANQSATADYAKGSNVITATAARSATSPDTYIDSSGKINLSTTADTLLFDQGYYDETGFHVQPGLHAYGTGMNYCLNSYFSIDSNSDGLADGLIKTYGTTTLLPSSIFNINNAKAQRVVYTYNGNESSWSSLIWFGTQNDSIDCSSGNVTVTFSYYIKGDLSGFNSLTQISFLNVSELDNSSNILRSCFALGINTAKKYIDSSVIRMSHTFTCTNTATRKIAIYFFLKSNTPGIPTSGETVNFEITNIQIEKSPYATPFIPTTTAALTRPATIIRSPTADNRNASEETIIAKFAPCSNFSNDGTYRALLKSDTKNRTMQKFSGSTTMYVYPNETDYGSVFASAITNLLGNTSYVIGASFQHSSPYVRAYTNGVLKSSYTTGDWTNPAWGTYWQIGSTYAGSSPFNGRIQSIAIFNRALTDDEVIKLSNSNFTVNNNSLLIAGN